MGRLIQHQHSLQSIAAPGGAGGGGLGSATFERKGIATTGTGSSSQTLDFSSIDIVEGDLLVVLIMSQFIQTDHPGWTQPYAQHTINSGGWPPMLYFRRANGADDLTWDISSGSAIGLVYSGARIGQEYSKSEDSVAHNQVYCADGARVFCALVEADGSPDLIVTPGSGYTQIAQTENDWGGSYDTAITLAESDALKSGSGNTTPGAWTNYSTGTNRHTVAFSINPFVDGN